MNTTFLLMAQYEKTLIPLGDFSEQYLGLKEKTAANKHAVGELGLPLIRMSKSQKSPLVIRIQDLADYIDQQAAEAKKECLKCAV